MTRREAGRNGRAVRFAPGGPLAAAALLALSGVLAPGPAAGQTEGRGRGWLGVALYDALVRCHEPRGGAARCERTAVVGQVVPGSPAARASLEPGDTLLALDGRRITGGARDLLFAGMRAGRPVRLEVGRDEGRLEVAAVPVPRPDDRPAPPRAGRASPSRSPGAAPGRPPEAVADVAGRVERRWVTIRLDSDSIRVSPMPVELRSRLPEDIAGVAGERVRERIARASGEARVAVGGTSDETVEGRLRVVRVGPDLWGRLEFGPRLRALQDSVFRHALVRFESIQARARRGGARIGVRSREGRPGAGREELFLPALSERRIAGAEFAALNPELAEVVNGPAEGLLVLRVLPETPAAELGLRPGDVVVEAAGRSCGELADLRDAMASAEGSRGVLVKWVRGGRVLSGTVRD